MSQESKDLSISTCPSDIPMGTPTPITKGYVAALEAAQVQHVKEIQRMHDVCDSIRPSIHLLMATCIDLGAVEAELFDSSPDAKEAFSRIKNLILSLGENNGEG